MTENMVDISDEPDNNSVYNHTQEGRGLIIWMALSIAFMLILALLIGEMITVVILASVAAILTIFLILFHKLTVTIDKEYLHICFGPCVIKKKFRLVDIEACNSVRNPLIYGLGIHKIPGGWIYNVSGREAVELKMMDGRVNRIGTDEPEVLREAIEKARNKAYG